MTLASPFFILVPMLRILTSGFCLPSNGNSVIFLPSSTDPLISILVCRSSSDMRFHKDNLRHLLRVTDFYIGMSDLPFPTAVTSQRPDEKTLSTFPSPSLGLMAVGPRFTLQHLMEGAIENSCYWSSEAPSRFTDRQLHLLEPWQEIS